MTPTTFLESLAWQLTLQRVPYVRPALENFVLDVWPLVEDGYPDPARWAREFAQTHPAAVLPR